MATDGRYPPQTMENSGIGLTVPGELIETIIERTTDRIADRLAQIIERERTSPWATSRDLAEHSGWGLSTVEKLSAANRIPGKVVHDGKVRFHLPTFDAWLLRDHQVGPATLTS